MRRRKTSGRRRSDVRKFMSTSFAMCWRRGSVRCFGGPGSAVYDGVQTPNNQ
jgi:hypothetical protein